MSRKLIQKVLKYTVIFEPAEEGGYVVSVPTLPGCVSEGDTFEEANEMIKDAMRGYLAVLKKEKLEIPEEENDVVVTQVSIPEPVISSI